VRGYISGSGWKTYQQDGTVCGIRLPKGSESRTNCLNRSLRLPPRVRWVNMMINISFEEVVGLIGKELAEQIRDASMAIYQKGAEIADAKGIIIADTKFEFGLITITSLLF
jgi:phosphoribosylaminoimidazole-succinocarboxamide synthase